MNKRIIFDSNEFRNLFFEKVLESFNIKKWGEVRKLFSIPKSTFEFYRNGRLTIPENLYELLIKNFDEKDKLFFSKKIKFLDSCWGNVKGGKITYSKYKEIFDKGRKKAILSRKKKAENKFNVHMPLNCELSYFIGLFIGDGFTNKYKRTYITEFTGDKRTEKLFYLNYITNTVQNLFNLTPRILIVPNENTIRFILYSKALFKMITQRFKIHAGRKSLTVLIPDEILNSNSEIIKACVRGIYDAEGCVFFDKRKVYKKPYVRIELHMNNLAILNQVHKLLKGFQIKSTLGIIKNNLRVTIYTKEEVKKFIKEIGFFNPKQLEKLKIYGY
ncbi:MAG: LAGLIDADG family homing endonuclease [Nanoarchaeota archaeon]